MNISPPQKEEYPEWFAAEIEPVPYLDLLSGLRDSLQHTVKSISHLDDELLAYIYAPGKWTIKEIWQHVIDVERILSYRALRYSRGDETVLSGFKETGYVEASGANRRPWADLIEEYKIVRASTIALFDSFEESMLHLKGTTGKSTMTVRAVGFLILGHEMHHLNTVRVRYIGH